MGICEVKKVKIGEGMPKVCIPIVADEIDSIIKGFEAIKDLDFDIIEFRIDYFKEIFNDVALDELFTKIKELNITKPIIITCRTSNEGGNVEITIPEYKSLYIKALQYNIFDIYDLELKLGTNLIIDLTTLIHENDRKVLISNHDFDRMHSIDTIMERFNLMNSYNGDIYKIAMMPETIGDVLSMLEVTDWATHEFTKPVVTMSMGQLGLMTRLVGEQFGSSITFATYDKSSAPGQINYEDVKTVLSIIHKSIK